MHHTRRSVLGSSSAALAAALFGLPRNAQAAEAIAYWHHFTSQEGMDGLARVSELFASDGRTVLPEGIPNAEYMSKVTTSAVAGSLPPSLMVLTARLADIAALGALQPVTDRVEGWERRGDFDQAAWDGITLDGEIYGVPAFTLVDWVYYRKDWFEEAGIALPKTWAEFGEAAVALTDPPKGRYGYGMRGGDGGQYQLFDLLRSYGAFDIEGGTVALNPERAKEALTFYAELMTAHQAVPESAPNDSFRQIMEGFKTGQTGMLWHHTGSAIDLTGTLNDDQIGTMIVPAGPAQHVAPVTYVFNSLTGEGDVETAWEWISFWAQPKAGLALLDATGYVPASNVVAQDPRIQGEPLYEAAIETLAIGTERPIVAGLDGWMKSALLPEFQKLLVGSSDVDEVVSRLERELDRSLR